MKPRLNKNQNGMSLIEVLVVTAIMGILSMGMMTMVDNANKATKSNQLTIEANDLDNRIQGYFLKSEYCKATLGGKSIAPGGQQTITEIKKDATTTLISSIPGPNKIGNLLVKSMLLKRNGASNDVELLVTFEKVNKTNSVGSETFKPRSVSIQAIFDVPTNPNKIVTCYSNIDSAITLARQLTCEDMCGPTCWNGVKCVFPPASKVYIDPNTGSLTKYEWVPQVKQESCRKCSAPGHKWECNPCTGGAIESARICSGHDLGCPVIGGSYRKDCVSTCTSTVHAQPFGNLIPFAP
jgi:prepilin-type N-terminal cleavage/methylation domain-containing protein